MPKRSPAAAPTAPKRLPKAERREQLLETARAIVREEGTDALTLGHLAERAGVTKPIAYAHFETRSGLLVALYQQIDDQQVAALRAALAETRPRLGDIARVVSKAYMDCYIHVGPEWSALSGALKGDERMEAFERALHARYVALYRDALAPHTTLPKRELHLRCVGILGAGDALAREMIPGNVDAAAAAATMASLIVEWLAPAR